MLQISKTLYKRAALSAKVAPEDIITNDLYSLRKVSGVSLVHTSIRNKINYQSTNPYNKRWQYKWKHAYYTYPKEDDHEHVKKPEDSKEAVPLFFAWFRDFTHRWLPGLQSVWERRNRLVDPFNVYFLPGVSLFFYQFSDVAFGFKWMTAMPWFLVYTRIRDRSLDPDLKETYLRDMIYRNPGITKYFNEETIHVIDYEIEYDKGFGDAEKFPEYNNKVWRFFNRDTSMTTGFFKFGDVESGAVMNLKFKTMPAPGKYRYQVGEPFFFYDLRAEIKHDGVFQEVVLVDEKETLRKIRPFLFLI